MAAGPTDMPVHAYWPALAQPAVRLDYCNSPASYLCVITAGPQPVQEDAFIEWFYHIPVETVGALSFITGKFTFSASAEYIRHCSGNGNDYANPNGLGLGVPMFVQPSHNQI